jgi:hypothetical protein
MPLADMADRFSRGWPGGGAFLVARAAVAAAAALFSVGSVCEGAMESRSQETLPLGAGPFG